MFRRDRLRFVATAIPTILAIIVAVQFVTTRRGATLLGPGLGADYPAFYAAGRLLLDHPGHRLYDLELQSRIEDEARPGAPPQGSLSFVHPPFTALPFILLAALPYSASYLTWMAVSVAIIALGLVVLRRACPSLSHADWVTAAGLAFAASPLLLESIVGGQIAVIAFAATALAFAFARLGRMFLAGIALSLLAYKPTLLVLFVPLLIFGRRWLPLAGLLTGCLILLTLSLMIAGLDGCRSWVGLMTAYGRLAKGSASTFRLFKFVDLTSFLHLAFGESPWVAGLSIALAVPPLVWLASAWGGRARFKEAPLWAATVTWTLVLNFHIAIYDVAAAMPGVLVTLDALARRHGGRLELSSFDRSILAIAWCMPWVAQACALVTHFHPLTLALAVLAAWQLSVAASCERGTGAAAHDSGQDHLPNPRELPGKVPVLSALT